MVKIEIDDAVRDYALDYSHRVMATCADVEEKLAELGTFVADNNDWNDKSAITDYIDLLIADYPKVLTLEPIEWKQYIDKYNEVLKREPNMLVSSRSSTPESRAGTRSWRASRREWLNFWWRNAGRTGL